MSYESTVLADSPIRYYRLGESSGVNAIDKGSQLQNGTITSVTYGTSGLLVADSDTAMTFDGTSSYITLPGSGLPTGSAAWTMECWIQTPNPLPSSGITMMMMMGVQTGGQGVTLHLGSASGGSISADAWGGASLISWSTVPGVATIYHVVSTYDGTTLSLYVNGALAGSIAASISIVAATPGAAIGASSSSTQDDKFSGVIDEVAIYGTALSATRIAAHYTAGTTGGIGADPTIFGSAVADATLTTACTMTTASGGVEVAKTTTVSGGAGPFVEITSKGLSLAAAAAIPAAPTGNGWVYTPGAGTFVLGNWSGIVALSTVVGVSPAVLSLRFFKLPGGVLASAVSIGSIPLSTSTTTSRAAYTFGSTSLPSVTFAASDVLYVDLWFNDAGGAFGDNPTVYLSTTSTAGVVNDMQVTTANFVPAVVVTTPANPRWHRPRWIMRPLMGGIFTPFQAIPAWVQRAITAPFVRPTQPVTIPRYVRRSLTSILINYGLDIQTRLRLRSGDQLQDISTRLVLISAVQSVRDISARLRLRSADQFKDVASRLRLRSADQLKNIASRLRLAKFVDIAARLRLVASQFKDVSTRLRLRSADQLKDITARLRVRSADQLKDVKTRVRLRSADQLRDIALRLRLRSADQLKDVIGRLRLAKFVDIASRLRLRSADKLSDITSRLRLRSADQLRDISSRLRVRSADQLKDVKARLRLRSADQLKDITTRLVLAAAQQRLKDIASRLRLRSANQFKDIQARLKLAKFVDIATRLRIRSANKLSDITARVRLKSADKLSDIASRVRLRSADQLRDVSTRVRMMSAVQRKDVASRVRVMSAAQLRDIAARLRQISQPQSKDIRGRLVLVIFAVTMKDIKCRLILVEFHVSRITVESARGTVTTHGARGKLAADGTRGELETVGSRGTLTSTGSRGTLTVEEE